MRLYFTTLHACARTAGRGGATIVQVHRGLLVAEPVHIRNTNSRRAPQPSRAMDVHSARRPHHQLATTYLWLSDFMQRTTSIDGTEKGPTEIPFAVLQRSPHHLHS